MQDKQAPSTTPRARVLPGTQRHDIVQLLLGQANVGVELGVAEGVFAQRMVDSGRFAHFFGVDMYADSHDTNEYKRALRAVGLRRPYTLLRMRFDEALDLFDDESLDFLYVDGYAHGGEDGGETLFAWSRKVKVGGVIAGDDYHPTWPLVMEAVQTFARQLDAELVLTERVEPDNPYCRYPTWALYKPDARPLAPPAGLAERGRRANARVARQRKGALWKRAVRATLPAPLWQALKSLKR